MSEPGRRELNKARTHQAMVDAARDLGRERGLENVTAEDIADRAGVSRRTFFNYFTGIESVVAAGLATPLQRIADALRARPHEEDPLTAIIAALRAEPLGADILLGWLPAAPEISLRGRELQLRVWQHHEDWLVGVLQERVPDGDDLRMRSLAAAVMSMFETVQRTWLPTAVELPPDEAVASFNDTLLRVLRYAEAGWREPAP
ncbi:MAG TPA: helix-turn-helix domain-containing protein [Actinomycetaceae bacterium]|nr:helix-turn-helix domain-containing protein [Actinomycetaceae bacterium]